MGKKILFIAPYPVGKAPSQRLKYEQYFEYFEADGFQITTHSFISQGFWKIIYQQGNVLPKIWYTLSGYLRRFFLLFSIRKYDIVYVHLWCTPFGPPFYETLVSILANKLLYDIDDLIYLKASNRAHPFVRFFKSSSKPLFLIKKADHVITCTPYLDAMVRELNQNTTDISSTINTKVYRPRTDYSIQGRELVLGWSGSYSTSKYLTLLSGLLIGLKEKLNFKLLVIGDPNFRIPGLEVEAIPWSKESEVEDLSRIDIGLYPLPDEEWVYGKSGLKALQYMALGIPTLATALGANFRIIEDAKTGFLIPTDDEKEWQKVILRLAEDESLRRSIGEEAARSVEANYSLNANAPTYLSILSKLLG